MNFVENIDILGQKQLLGGNAMEYTDNMMELLFLINEEVEDDDGILYDRIVSVFDDNNYFRDFGEGLREIIRRKMPEGMEISEMEYLRMGAQKHNIEFNRNTLKGWFNGNRPKKGNESRRHMFLIAFALELTIQETNELFHKVYYDKGINARNRNEVVYSYCLKNKLSLAQAERIINEISKRELVEDSVNEGTVYTKVLSGELGGIQDDEKLIQYILKYSHNFSLSNVSAVKKVQELLMKIRPSKEEQILWKKRREKTIQVSEDESYSYIFQECIRNYEIGEIVQNKSISSLSTVLDVVLGIDIVKAQKESRGSIFKNRNLPQEIVNRFPTKHSFSKLEKGTISHEELRKLFVLLQSYVLWYEMQYNEMQLDLDTYKAEMDCRLFEMQLSELYYGNPFDWLFLYCSIQEKPLNYFRDIIDTIINSID